MMSKDCGDVDVNSVKQYIEICTIIWTNNFEPAHAVQGAIAVFLTIEKLLDYDKTKFAFKFCT